MRWNKRCCSLNAASWARAALLLIASDEKINGRIASDSIAPMRNERRPGAARNRVIPIALHTKVTRGGPTLARTAGTDHKSCRLRSAGGVSPQFRGKLWQIGKRRFPKAFQVASGPNQTRR